MLIELLLLLIVTYGSFRMLWYFWLSRLLLTDIHGRAVLITGCDSGFGLALSERLASQGITVYAGCLTKAGLDGLAVKGFANLHGVQMDVTNVESVRGAFEYVCEHLDANGKQLWGIVNNAGVVGSMLPIEISDVTDFHDVMQVNYFGTVNVTKQFMGRVAFGRGRIVTVSSFAGLVPTPNLAAYNASKFAIEGFIRTLRLEMQPWGVSVSLVEPQKFITHIAALRNDKRRQTWQQVTPQLQRKYRQTYEQMMSSKSDTESDPPMSGSNLTPVLDAYEHALFDRYPQSSYVVGCAATLIYWTYMHMPEWLADIVVNAATSRSKQTRVPTGSDAVEKSE